LSAEANDAKTGPSTFRRSQSNSYSAQTLKKIVNWPHTNTTGQPMQHTPDFHDGQNKNAQISHLACSS
jgi:hypothetical protein